MNLKKLISITSPAFEPISILSPTLKGERDTINNQPVILVIGSLRAIATPAETKPK